MQAEGPGVKVGLVGPSPLCFMEIWDSIPGLADQVVLRAVCLTSLLICGPAGEWGTGPLLRAFWSLPEWVSPKVVPGLISHC